MAYFERKRKRILALSGLTTNKARDMVLRSTLASRDFATPQTRVHLIVVYSVKGGVTCTCHK